MKFYNFSAKNKDVFLGNTLDLYSKKQMLLGLPKISLHEKILNYKHLNSDLISVFISEKIINEYFTSGLLTFHDHYFAHEIKVVVNEFDSDDDFIFINKNRLDDNGGAQSKFYENTSLFIQNEFAKKELVKNKVVVYVTGKTSLNKLDVLVFEHVKYPEVGIQVPAGTIKDGEDPLHAAKRELEEESGLIIEKSKFQLIDNYYFFNPYQNQFQRRWVYNVNFNRTKNEEVDFLQKFNHVASDDGLSGNEEFSFSWINIDEAYERMIGLGDKLLLLMKN